MNKYGCFIFEKGYFRDINIGNFISVYNIKTILNNIDRDSLTISNGYSVITLDDLNINIYRENIGWKKITGMRGFGTDPYSPRSTALFSIERTCYNINIESINIEQFNYAFDIDKTWAGSCSNSVNNRGVFTGGSQITNSLEYINIINCNTSFEFGSLIYSQSGICSLSNGVNNRGIFAGGNANVKDINYITVSTFSNSINFGELNHDHAYSSTSSNNTGNKGLIFGHLYTPYFNTVVTTYGLSTKNNPPSSYTNLLRIGLNNIDYITISITCNSVLFGQLSQNTILHGSASNSEYNRSVTISGCLQKLAYTEKFWKVISGNIWEYYYDWGGNVYDVENTSLQYSIIEYLSIITQSNADSFGNLSINQYTSSVTSNGIRNRGIEYGNNGSNTFGSIFNFLYIGGTADLCSQLSSYGFQQQLSSISNS